MCCTTIAQRPVWSCSLIHVDVGRRPGRRRAAAYRKFHWGFLGDKVFLRGLPVDQCRADNLRAVHTPVKRVDRKRQLLRAQNSAMVLFRSF
jgi:hypothetical protein